MHFFPPMKLSKGSDLQFIVLCVGKQVEFPKTPELSPTPRYVYLHHTQPLCYAFVGKARMAMAIIENWSRLALSPLCPGWFGLSRP